MGTRVRVSLRIRVSDRVRASLRVGIRFIAQSQVGNTLGTTVRGRVRAGVEVSIRRARSRRSRTRIEYLIPKNNIIVLNSYFKLTNKSYLIHRF